MRRIAACIVLCAFFALAESGCAEPLLEWTTAEIDGRNYVELTEVAAAFELARTEEREDPNEIGFKSDRHSLVVKIDSRQAILDGVRHWFSFPVVTSDDGGPRISLVDLQSTVIPAFQPELVEGLPDVKTVVFDPGHGGDDPGAIGYYGKEKDYTLDLVKRTRRILEDKGIKVVQSRLSDFFVPLSTRPAMTKNYDDPIFISIHLNGSSNREANGMEVFALTPPGAPATGGRVNPKDDSKSHANSGVEPASFVLANTVYQRLLGKMGSFDRGVKRARFSVLRHAETPAILVEGGFLTNREEAKRIETTAWRENYATALAEGIEAYMKLANDRTPPPRATDLGHEPTDEFVPE